MPLYKPREKTVITISNASSAPWTDFSKGKRNPKQEPLHFCKIPSDLLLLLKSLYTTQERRYSILTPWDSLLTRCAPRVRSRRRYRIQMFHTDAQTQSRWVAASAERLARAFHTPPNLWFSYPSPILTAQGFHFTASSHPRHGSRILVLSGYGT